MRKRNNRVNKRLPIKLSSALTNPKYRIYVFVGVFTIIGATLFVFSKAATPTAKLESENGQLNGPVVTVGNDSGSSGGYVKFSQIKPQIKGVTDRDPYNYLRTPDKQNLDIPAEFVGSINNFALKVYWRDIQPNNSNELDTTVIDDSISEANALGMHMKLRVMSGREAPTWVKNLAGGQFDVYDVDQTTGEVFTGTSPKYWTAEYKTAYSNLMQKLADKYDDNNTLLSVVNSMCTTIFAEPFIKNLEEGNNMDSFYGAGLTDALDKDCHNNSVDIHAAIWKRTRTETAVNPLSYKGTNSSGSIIERFDPDFSIAWVQRCRQILGERCILGNNGFNVNTSAGSTNYRRVIGEIICEGNPPPYFQTRQYPVILSTGNTIEGVLQYAIDVGAGMVELPQQYKTGGITPQVLAPLDTALENNNAIPCPSDRLLPNPM